MTLPTDSNERKNYPLFRGCLRYFPSALAGIAKISKLGNDKHNPGQELHHNRDKSGDHGDCILRHLTDVEDLLSALSKNEKGVTSDDVLNEVNQMAWRALAFSQLLHEKFGAPLAPAAKSQSVSAVDLHAQAEEAHKKIENMMSEIRSLEKPKVKFVPGDIVKHVSNDTEVVVEGTYFDEKGKPVLFIKDANNKVFGVDPDKYKSIYVERKD